jgi:cellulose synthase/poly-beta-1,6-N-acetylglucosamine synthase-like glycosyltransferase
MIYVILTAITIFAIRTLIFYIGVAYARKETNIKSNELFEPFVSVIIPSRNEENNIENCINYFNKSDYPKNKFEIIAVDDRSTDKTPQIIANLQLKYENLKVVTVTEKTKNINLKGKPGALSEGIKAATGELILMTDADCEVNPKWISTIVQQFNDKELGLLSSFTLIKEKSIFDKLQALEWIYMSTMASGGVGVKQPLGCFGNNLTIRKSVYDKLGGYENIKFSVTEDLALQQAVFKTDNKVKFICDYNSTVTTLPVATFGEYVSQHRRWALGGFELGWRAVIFVASSAAIWIGLLAALISGNFLWMFAIIITRIFGDFTLIQQSITTLKQEHLSQWIIPSVFYQMLIELIIPPSMLNKKIQWKGQIFGK